MPASSSPGQGGRVRSFLSARFGRLFGEQSRRHWVDYGFMAAFVILLLIAASASDVFFTQRNVSNLFRQIVTNGLISLGMLVVILTGGIDLSVGSVVALATVAGRHRGFYASHIRGEGATLLDAVQEAFEAAASGSALKVIVTL